MTATYERNEATITIKGPHVSADLTHQGNLNISYDLMSWVVCLASEIAGFVDLGTGEVHIKFLNLEGAAWFATHLKERGLIEVGTDSAFLEAKETGTCPDCNGTGRIILFTTQEDCKCSNARH